MDNGSTSRRTLVSGSLVSRSTLTSATSVSGGSLYKPLIIAQTYRVGRKLGFGNFGEVRYGKDIVTGNFVAIKLESKKARSPQLYNEYRYYTSLGVAEGIPKVYYYGPFSVCNALVLELLGPNLEELFMKSNRKFSYKTILMIAMQLIKRFEYVHSKGIIFRDVKPENFVVGNRKDNEGLIYIIDFGLAKYYYNFETKQHIPFCSDKSLSGTARYMSLNTHLGYEQSRRDDLESLGHMLIYFLRGALPWQGLKADSIFERYIKIGEVKKITPVSALCYNLADEWVEYMTYVKQLDFYENPDYTYLYNIFYNSCKKHGFIVDNKFEWVENRSMYFNNSNSHTPKRSLRQTIHTGPTNSTYDGSEGFQSVKTTNYYPDFPLTNHGHLNQNVVDVNNFHNEIDNVKYSKKESFNSYTPDKKITSTILNDMKHNQQNRVESFKSHSRKPTPSHFNMEKGGSKKIHQRATFSKASHLNSEPGSNNSSFGRLDDLKISIWNCCYKFRRASRVDNSYESSCTTFTRNT